MLSLLVLLTVAMAHAQQSLSIVPQPESVEFKKSNVSHYQLPNTVSVSIPENKSWRLHIEIVATHIKRLTSGRHELKFTSDKPGALSLREDKSLFGESYRLDVEPEGVVISASTLKALTNATATLIQLVGSHSDGKLPLLSIKDAPKTAYRNFMIDMGRNPHSLELLKETVDLLWFYKVDSLQLHLTDDQRFAFPSTAFPKLWDGIISADQFRELESYAYLRGVSIIPELEVPGHSSLLRNRYPDVFGKSATDLASSETALKGIKTLLDEMMDIFKSTPYVHVGGDEAYGVPEDLQRDLINKLHAYLKSKGRKTLVWEGPSSGKGNNKVNEEVIHLNWRTIAYRPDQMLADGYPVVNAAWDPLYLVDHYPRINFTMCSPQHIYETMSLTRFKHVNPGISTYKNPIFVQPSEKLLGFCMPWWEGRESNYFAQAFPRVIPFAEVAWHMPEKRNHSEYSKRAAKAERIRRTTFYPVRIKANWLVVAEDGVFHTTNNERGATISFDANSTSKQIRFTLDGSQPNPDSPIYTKPFVLKKTSTVRAALFDGERQVGHGIRRNLTAVTPVPNLALGKPVTSTATSAAPFSVGRLTDGGTHFLDFYLGYPADPNPIKITVDLKMVHRVSRIVVHAYAISNSFEKYSVEVSEDGKKYVEVASRLSKPDKETREQEHKFTSRPVRYIRVVTHGNKGYVFDSFSKLTEIQAFE